MRQEDVPALGTSAPGRSNTDSGVPSFQDPRPRHFLRSGELMVCSRPSIITTILGSCVSVCLFDPFKLVGGMNHYMLPDGENGPDGLFRIAQMANHVLLERMLALGSDRRSLQAKVFGGAHLLAPPGTEAGLGQRNAEVAMQFLEQHGITVMARDVGGSVGRKILFASNEGAVWVKSLRGDRA